MSEAVAGFLLALVWLTRLPVGGFLPVDPPPLARAAWAFPLVGLVVGSIAAAVFAATMALGLPQALAAILAVAAMVWLSGGLHEDGLADLADGMGGPNRERRLEIMRDSRIGSYGALTLGLVTAIRITALAVLPVPAAIGAFFTLPALSRAMMVATMVMLAPARADGLGKAAGRPSASLVAIAGLLALSLCAVASLSGLWPGFWPAAGVILAACAATLHIQRLARNKLGGLTGDVLGAVQQVSEAAALLVLAAALAEKL